MSEQLHLHDIERSPGLSHIERRQIAAVLSESANEIAMWKEREFRGEIKPPFEVERAMSREIRRLRRLADRVKPFEPEDTYEDERD